MELFQPNNLSVYKPTFTPLRDPVLISEIASALNRSYGVSASALRISQFVGANVSSQNLLIESTTEKYFLKKRPVNQVQQLENEVTLTANLGRLKVKVPQVISTSSGRLVHEEPGWCCALYSFEDGYYFSGKGTELDSAAEAFAVLTKAVLTLPQEQTQTTKDDAHIVGELPSLLSEAAKDSRLAVRELSEAHSELVLEHISGLAPDLETLQAECLPLHLDFHPLNLLMKDGVVSCILDFEHIKVYPVLAGLGFASYKLVRQALVIEEMRSREFARPELLTRWLHSWCRFFPQSQFTPQQLMRGASYRVLFIIHLILNSYLRNNDDRSLYDLEKQFVSLYEIDAITRLY